MPRTFYLSCANSTGLARALQRRGGQVAHRGERVVARCEDGTLKEASLASGTLPTVWAVDDDAFDAAKSAWL
jgi:hypothetical protein